MTETPDIKLTIAMKRNLETIQSDELDGLKMQVQQKTIALEQTRIELTELLWGVHVGGTVFTRKGEAKVVRIEMHGSPIRNDAGYRNGYDSKPWLIVMHKRKDGTWSGRKEHVYGGWDVQPMRSETNA